MNKEIKKKFDIVNNKLKALSELEGADRYLDTVNIILGLINELEGDLKGAKYNNIFRHGRMKINVIFGDYYD